MRVMVSIKQNKSLQKIGGNRPVQLIGDNRILFAKPQNINFLKHTVSSRGSYLSGSDVATTLPQVHPHTHSVHLIAHKNYSETYVSHCPLGDSLRLFSVKRSMSASYVVTPSVRTELFSSSVSKRSTFPAQTRRARNKCEISRRDFAVRGIVASGVSVMGSPSSPSAASQPVQGGERLAFKPEGYNFWEWRGHKIHYVVQGEGLPLVLIHGFGASVFHWRYNIPELAKKYKVYALDLLGFGWSDKALIEYDAMVWTDQVIDFIKEIVKEPTVVVGNSLGGFTALSVAVGLPEQVTGVALLNSAGQFATESKKQEEAEETVITTYLVKPLKEVFQRVVLGFLFWQAKQPSRIESVLKSVYINATNVDDYLVESISKPATDPNAGEVYYRLMTRFLTNQSRYTLDSVLSKMTCPLLLLWGDLDPWVGPAKAEKIKAFYSNSSLVHLQAGHCPHDEVPEAVNIALLDWLSNVVSKPSSPEVSEV